MEDFWWQKEYPSIPKGQSNKEPHHGLVVQFFRRRTLKEGKMVTQDDFARMLHVNRDTVNVLEQTPHIREYSRRFFAAQAFGIPFALLGLETVGGDTSQQAITGSTSGGTGPSLMEASPLVVSTQFLASMIKLDTVSTAMPCMTTIHAHLLNLYREMFYTTDTHTRLQIMKLACHFEQFEGRLFTDSCMFTDAKTCHQRAGRLINEIDDPELTGLYWLRRGWTYQDEENLPAAIQCLGSIMRYQQNLSDALRFCLFHRYGLAKVKWGVQQNDREERIQGMALIEKSGDLVRSHPFIEETYDTDYSLKRYRITRGVALIHVGQTREAIDVLSQEDGEARRNAFAYYLLAKAYLGEKAYPQVVSHLSAALPDIKQIGSLINLKRIGDCYGQLLDSSYRKERDVRELSFQLKG